MTEEIVVIAMRAVVDADHIADSKIRHCKECGMACWVAPSSPPDAKVMCNQCAVDLVEWDDPDLEIMEWKPEQMAELVDYFARKKS